jgi:hypothetical protein
MNKEIYSWLFLAKRNNIKERIQQVNRLYKTIKEVTSRKIRKNPAGFNIRGPNIIEIDIAVVNLYNENT